MILDLQFRHVHAHLSVNKLLEMPCLSFPVTAVKLPASVISPRQFVQIELSSRPSVCLQIQSEYGQIGIEVFLACCQSKSLSIARKRETALNLAPECVCVTDCVVLVPSRLLWESCDEDRWTCYCPTYFKQFFFKGFFKRRIFPWHNVILAIFWYCNCARKEFVYVFTFRVSHRGKKSIMYLEREKPRNKTEAAWLGDTIIKLHTLHAVSTIRPIRCWEMWHFKRMSEP